MRQNGIVELLAFWFILEVGGGPNTPLEWCGMILCAPVIADGRNEVLIFFCRLFRSSTNRATPIASVNVRGCLILASKQMSSLRPAIKQPTKKFSGNPSIQWDNFSKAS